MEFSASRKGAALVSLWFFLAGAVISVPFWKNFPALTLLLLTVLAAACFLLAQRLASCRVRVGVHHITVRRGILLLTTRRIPLHGLTGCQLLATPLQRRTGTCVLVLSSSGCTTLLPGVPAEQAARLCALLTQGGTLP